MFTQSKYYCFFIITILILLFYANAYHTPFLVDDFLYLGELKLSDLKKFLKGASPGMDDTLGRTLFYGNHILKANTYCTVDSDEFVPPPVDNAKLSFGIPENKVGITYYRPLQLLFNSLPYQFFGDNYHLHHLLNVLLHILITFMVFNIVVELSNNEKWAFIAALLFAGLPVHTEAVTKVKGLADLLITILTLFTFNYAVRYLKTSRKYFLILSVFFFFTGFILKQIIVMVPACIFAYEIIIVKRLKIKIRELPGLLVKYIPYFMVAVVLIAKQLHSAGMGMRRRHELMVIFEGMKFEFESMFFPFQISLLLLLLFVPLIFFRKNREFLFFTAWTFIMFIPDLYVQAKWNCYLSSIGFCASIGWLITRLDNLVEREDMKVKKIYMLIDLGLAFTSLCYLYLMLEERRGKLPLMLGLLALCVLFSGVLFKFFLLRKKIIPSLFSGKITKLFQFIIVIFILSFYLQSCIANNNLLYDEGAVGAEFAAYLKKNFPDMKKGDEIYIDNLSLNPEKVIWRPASLVYSHQVFISYPESFYLLRETLPTPDENGLLFINYNNGIPLVDNEIKEILLMQDEYFKKKVDFAPIFSWDLSGSNDDIDIFMGRKSIEQNMRFEGEDIVIQISALALHPWQVKKLEIELASSGKSDNQISTLFWGNDLESSRLNGNQIEFTIISDDNLHTYNFQLYKNFKWLSSKDVSRFFIYIPGVYGKINIQGVKCY